MKIIRCREMGCECNMGEWSVKFDWPKLGSNEEEECDCGHGKDTHELVEETYAELWSLKVFPIGLVPRESQIALKIASKEYNESIRLRSKHTEYYRRCDHCGNRIRRRHKANSELTGGMGILCDGMYVHQRCLDDN